jgi:hypothetical protein
MPGDVDMLNYRKKYCEIVIEDGLAYAAIAIGLRRLWYILKLL